MASPECMCGFRGAGHAEAGQPGRSPWLSRIETGDGVVREIRASTLGDKVPPRIGMPMSVVDSLFGLEGLGVRDAAATIPAKK